jgi:hypothetical protein
MGKECRSIKCKSYVLYFFLTKLVKEASVDEELGEMAPMFTRTFRESVTLVDTMFGDTSTVCNAWCKLLSRTIRDVWDSNAEAARNAGACMVLFGSSKDHAAMGVIEALQLCSKFEQNIPVFIESGICGDLVQFLEACLESAEGVLQVPSELNGATQALILLGNLLSFSTFCDAVAGSRIMFVLLTLPVRECLPHNEYFSLTCGKVILDSVKKWGPAVLTYLNDSDWIGFMLARVDSDYGQVGDEMLLLIFDVRRATARCWQLFKKLLGTSV